MKCPCPKGSSSRFLLFFDYDNIKYMQILDKKLENKVKIVSKKLGLNEREFVNRSVLAYLSEFQNAINLKKELDGWDMFSAISMRKNNF